MISWAYGSLKLAGHKFGLRLALYYLFDLFVHGGQLLFLVIDL
jgi:hypothetical protein